MANILYLPSVSILIFRLGLVQTSVEVLKENASSARKLLEPDVIRLTLGLPEVVHLLRIS